VSVASLLSFEACSLWSAPGGRRQIQLSVPSPSTAIYFEITDKRRAANFQRMLRSRAKSNAEEASDGPIFRFSPKASISRSLACLALSEVLPVFTRPLGCAILPLAYLATYNLDA
jgi:hypothetical protein